MYVVIVGLDLYLQKFSFSESIYHSLGGSSASVGALFGCCSIVWKLGSVNVVHIAINISHSRTWLLLARFFLNHSVLFHLS